MPATYDYSYLSSPGFPLDLHPHGLSNAPRLSNDDDSYHDELSMLEDSEDENSESGDDEGASVQALPYSGQGFGVQAPYVPLTSLSLASLRIPCILLADDHHTVPPKPRVTNRLAKATQQTEGSGLSAAEFKAKTFVKEYDDVKKMAKKQIAVMSDARPHPPGRKSYYNKKEMFEAMKAGELVVLCAVCLHSKEQKKLNSHLENLTVHLTRHFNHNALECKYASHGCETRFSVKGDVKQHAKTCEHNPNHDDAGSSSSDGGKGGDKKRKTGSSAKKVTSKKRKTNQNVKKAPNKKARKA